MTAIAHHHGSVSQRSVGSGEGTAAHGERVRSRPPSLLPASTTVRDTNSSAESASWPAADTEPGRARSAVPVLVSVVMLFGLAVAAAFGGRMVVDALSGLLAGGA